MAIGLVTSQDNVNAATTVDSNHVLVEKNDNLSKIANDYNTTVDTLVRENNIANKDLIHIGDKLVIHPTVNSNSQNSSASVTSQLASDDKNNISQQIAVSNTSQKTSPVSSTNSAKEWIAGRESGGDYNARNGRYIGRYQLDAAYLNGDYSPANQERVAEKYMSERYGSWTAAQAFWQAHNWW